MNRLFALILSFVLLAGISSEVNATDKRMTGVWQFEAPSAPYGYQKGTITIEEKENKLTGEVKFSDGYKIELKDIVIKGDSLTFGLYVDYTYISVQTMVDAKNVMTGTAQTPEGPVKVTAKKGN